MNTSDTSTPAPPSTEPMACRVPAENTDEHAAFSGLPTTPFDPLTPGQRMKEKAMTAYRGLITVVQALSDCLDIFRPLKATCNVILTIHKTFDVR
jgi:hypothetical protein